MGLILGRQTERERHKEREQSVFLRVDVGVCSHQVFELSQVPADGVEHPQQNADEGAVEIRRVGWVIIAH